MQDLKQKLKNVFKKTKSVITSSVTAGLLASSLFLLSYSSPMQAKETQNKTMCITYFKQHGYYSSETSSSKTSSSKTSSSKTSSSKTSSSKTSSFNITSISSTLAKKLDGVFNAQLSSCDSENLAGLITGEYWVNKNGVNKDEITIKSKYLNLLTKKEFTQEASGSVNDLEQLVNNLAGQIILNSLEGQDEGGFTSTLKNLFLEGKYINEGVGIEFGLAVGGDNKLVYSSAPSINVDYLKCITPKICALFGGGYKCYFTKTDNNNYFLHVANVRLNISYIIPLSHEFIFTMGGGVAGIITNQYTSFDVFKPQMKEGYIIELGLEKQGEKSSFFFKARATITTGEQYLQKTKGGNTIYPLNLTVVETVIGYRF